MTCAVLPPPPALRDHRPMPVAAVNHIQPDRFEECRCPRCGAVCDLVPPDKHEKPDGTLEFRSYRYAGCPRCGWLGLPEETIHHRLTLAAWADLLWLQDRWPGRFGIGMDPQLPATTAKPEFLERPEPRFPTACLPGGKRKMLVMTRRVKEGYRPTHPLDAEIPEELEWQIDKHRKAPNGRFKIYDLIQRWEDDRGITGGISDS